MAAQQAHLPKAPSNGCIIGL